MDTLGIGFLLAVLVSAVMLLILRSREADFAQYRARCGVDAGAADAGRARDRLRQRLVLRARGIRLEPADAGPAADGVPRREYVVCYGGARLGRIAQAFGADGRPDGPWCVHHAGEFCGVPLERILGLFPGRVEAAEALVQAHWAALLMADRPTAPNDPREAIREFRRLLAGLLGRRSPAVREGWFPNRSGDEVVDIRRDRIPA